MKSLLARISSSGSDSFNWPPKMKMYGSGLRSLMPNEEQYYVQFAMRVNDLTAAVFQSFTGRPLLGMIADRAFVAVGSRDWMQLALEFPGTAFVSVRSPTSKVSACALSNLRCLIVWLADFSQLEGAAAQVHHKS
jgi:hypothetical protein